MAQTKEISLIVEAAKSAQQAGIEAAQAASQKGKTTQATRAEADKAAAKIGGGVVEAVFLSGGDKCRIYYTQAAIVAAFAAAYGVGVDAVRGAIKELFDTPTLPYLWAAARQAATPEVLFSLI